MTNVLRTEYYCATCQATFKKIDSIVHKIDTDHSITKKVIHPSYREDVPETVDIELTQTIILEPETIDYCRTCIKEVFAPSLHRSRGHKVFKKKRSL